MSYNPFFFSFRDIDIFEKVILHQYIFSNFFFHNRLFMSIATEKTVSLITSEFDIVENDARGDEWLIKRNEGILNTTLIIKTFLLDREEVKKSADVVARGKGDTLGGTVSRWRKLERPLPTANELIALHTIKEVQNYISKNTFNVNNSNKRKQTATESIDISHVKKPYQPTISNTSVSSSSSSSHTSNSIDTSGGNEGNTNKNSITSTLNYTTTGGSASIKSSASVSKSVGLFADSFNPL